jgi:nucleotide-binding universal stress UspA family protein
MPDIARLLVVVDESPGSKRALEYTGKMLGGRRGFQIRLLQLLPPLPPELLEFGGAENPGKEAVLEKELRQQQKQWIAAAKLSAKPALNEAVKTLRKSGVAARNIQCAYSDPTDSGGTARVVLEQARATGCRTLVLGHHAHSWFREIAGGHLAEHILRHASGISVWVVQ